MFLVSANEILIKLLAFKFIEDFFSIVNKSGGAGDVEQLQLSEDFRFE